MSTYKVPEAVAEPPPGSIFADPQMIDRDPSAEQLTGEETSGHGRDPLVVLLDTVIDRMDIGKIRIEAASNGVIRHREVEVAVPESIGDTVVLPVDRAAVVG